MIDHFDKLSDRNRWLLSLPEHRSGEKATVAEPAEATKN